MLALSVQHSDSVFCRLHFIIDYNKASGILRFLGRKVLWETVLITDLHKQGSLELKHHKANQLSIFFHLFLTALGLHRYVWALFCCSRCGVLFVAVLRIFTEGSSFVVASGLWSTGSVVAVHGLSCSSECGIFLD